MKIEERVEKILSENQDKRTITVVCTSEAAEECIVPMLEYMAKIGNVGHSYDIIVDPHSNDEKKFGFDGDGASYIHKVEMK